GDARALDQRAELRPDDAFVNFLAAGEGAESAIGAGDDVLAPDDPRKAHDALGHQLRMLDEYARLRNGPRDENHAIGKSDVLPYAPLVLVARVRGFERDCTGPDLEHDVDEVLELQVVNARTDIDAVTGMPAHAVARDAAQGMVQGFDP